MLRCQDSYPIGTWFGKLDIGYSTSESRGVRKCAILYGKGEEISFNYCVKFFWDGSKIHGNMQLWAEKLSEKFDCSSKSYLFRNEHLTKVPLFDWLVKFAYFSQAMRAWARSDGNMGKVDPLEKALCRARKRLIQRDLDGAIELLTDTANEIRPGPINSSAEGVYAELGNFLILKGDSKLAVSILRRAVDFHPSSNTLKLDLARLMMLSPDFSPNEVRSIISRVARCTAAGTVRS